MEKLMLRIVSGLFALASVGLVVGFFLSRPNEPDPAFQVESTTCDLGDIVCGTHVVAFTITNPAEHSRRILGVSEV